MLATLAATVLIFTGFFLSPPGISSALVVLNRCMGTGMLWFTTVVLTRLQFNEALQREREAAWREVDRLNRLYAALSQINQAIVWMPTRDELFQKVCQVLVEHGGFHLAWIGWHDPDTHQLGPSPSGATKTTTFAASKSMAMIGRKATARPDLAFRARRPYICNDLLNDPVTLPWRAELLRPPFQSFRRIPHPAKQRSGRHAHGLLGGGVFF